MSGTQFTHSHELNHVFHFPGSYETLENGTNKCPTLILGTIAHRCNSRNPNGINSFPIYTKAVDSCSANPKPHKCHLQENPKPQETLNKTHTGCAYNAPLDILSRAYAPLDILAAPSPKQARIGNTPPKGHRQNIHRNMPSRKPKASRLVFEEDDDIIEFEAQVVEPYSYAKHCKSKKNKICAKNNILCCFFANISSFSIKTKEY